MNRFILIILVLFTSQSASAQKNVLGFECHALPALKGFTEDQIDTLISHINMEKFRLRDKRSTLAFDNGFEIIMLSAAELLRQGMVPETSVYPESYPAGYRLPSFHLMPSGRITMEYSSGRSQYRR